MKFNLKNLNIMVFLAGSFTFSKLLTKYNSGRFSSGGNIRPLSVVYGVLQGSNDQGQISNDSDIIIFADDTNIFIRATSNDAAYAKANDIL